MRSYLVHGVWLAVALVAFALGAVWSGGRGSDATNELGGDPDRGSRSVSSLSPLQGGAEGADRKRKTTGSQPALGAEAGDLLARFANVPELSDIDIEELGTVFRTDTNPVRRRLAFARMLEGLTVDNAKLMREQLGDLRSDSAEFREFHYAWGAIGGSDAVWNGADTPERDMAATLAGWASADAGAAKAWFDSLPEGKGYNRDELKGGLVHGLAANDTAAAADFVFGLSANGDKQAEHMLGIVTGYVLRGSEPAEAADWASALPPGSLRASAMDRVAHDSVARDPRAAAAWATQFAGEKENARVIEEVGDEWAERDPVASVAWLESLDTGEGKIQGMRSAFDEWAERDARAASQYLVDMPVSPERDAAIRGLAGEIAGEDPEAAIAWASEISDTSLRQNALVRVGQAYVRRDGNAARAWLANSGLPAEAQQQVLNPPRRR